MLHFDHDPGLGHVPDADHASHTEHAPAEPVRAFAPHDDLSAAAMSLAAGEHSAVGVAGQLGLPVEFGDPGEYHGYWFFQGHNETCAPASVTQVIEAQTGINLHGEALVQHELAELHLPSGNLTLPQAQTVLNHFDIPSHLQHYPNDPKAAMAQLEKYLAGGKNVVLSVNASPIWYDSMTAGNEKAAEGLPSDEWADHAVVVSAVNTQTGMVTLSDTGNPGGDGLPLLGNHDGNEEQVPLSLFLDAWQGSNYSMLVTDDHDGGADQHAATEAVYAASGTPAPGDGLSAGQVAASAAAGCVLLGATLGIYRTARSGKPMPRPHIPTIRRIAWPRGHSRPATA
jgi:hypothetical protein